MTSASAPIQPVMKKETVKALLQWMITGLRFHFIAYTNTLDAFHLHQFRLHVKRLRALARLMDFHYPAMPFSKRIQFLNPVYTLSGKIRDKSLTLKTLQKQKKQNTATCMSLEKEIRRHAKKVISEKKAFKQNLNRFAKSSASSMRKIELKKADLLIENLTGLMCLLLHQPDLRSRLHLCRKIIKQILYLTALSPVAWQKEFPVHQKSLTQLAQEIGKWNDLQYALKEIRQRASNPKSLRELQRQAAIHYMHIKKLARKIKLAYPVPGV